jgi:hypothetical protein
VQSAEISSTRSLLVREPGCHTEQLATAPGRVHVGAQGSRQRVAQGPANVFNRDVPHGCLNREGSQSLLSSPAGRERRKGLLSRLGLILPSKLAYPRLSCQALVRWIAIPCQTLLSARGILVASHAGSPRPPPASPRARPKVGMPSARSTAPRP